jgi:hypothetical protein
MPRMKKLHIATLSEVTITREEDAAIIKYKKGDTGSMRLTLGARVHEMSNAEILEAFNDTVRAMEESAAEYENIVVEIPEGHPQVYYFEEGDQWVPEGGVLRCVIDERGPEVEATIWIDDREFTLREFGKMLLTHTGWGMRISFVPDDRLNEEPRVEVRLPDHRAC